MLFFPRKPNTFHHFFLLFLFGLFAILSLAITALGANAYRQATSELDTTHNFQEVHHRITEQIRACGNHATILIQNKENNCLFLIRENETGTNSDYTCFYQYDGYLYENTISTMQNFSYKDGKKLMPASDFFAEKKSDRLYKLTISDDAQITYTFYLAANPLI